MADATMRITVSGYVQGVGFRYFVVKRAYSLGLGGYVSNLPSGQVEIVAYGDRGLIDDLVREVKVGPRSASVSGVEVEEITPTKPYHDFNIR